MSDTTLYLIRHPHAGSLDDGPSEAFRPLSDRGEAEARDLGNYLLEIMGCQPNAVLREASRRSQLAAQYATGQGNIVTPIETSEFLAHTGKSIDGVNIDVYRAMLSVDGTGLIFLSRRAILAALREEINQLVAQEQSSSYLQLVFPTIDEVERQPPHDASIVPTGSVTRVRITTGGSVVVDYYGLSPKDAARWARQNKE
ncbi:MAG: hypothetical protein WBB39_00350 [Candidatus Saccharimonadales bacterium]